MQPPFRPDRKALSEAAGKTIPDVIGSGLHILFCGINPGLYSAAIGHHFGRPGNRFWPALHQAGFTDRLLTGWNDRELLQVRCGITNLVARATVSADELNAEEFRSGAQIMLKKIRRYQPRTVAILGIGAYRMAFGKKDVEIGHQAEKLGTAHLWILPNPSGLNAHYQMPELARQFRALKEFSTS